MNGGDPPFGRKFEQYKFSASFLIYPDTSVVRSKANILIMFLHGIESLVHSAKLSFGFRKIRNRFFVSWTNHAQPVVCQQPVITGFVLMYFKHV